MRMPDVLDSASAPNIARCDGNVMNPAWNVMPGLTSLDYRQVVAFTPEEAPRVEAQRAFVLHESQVIVDLIELTLNHGLFVVRATSVLAEAEAILAAWQPHMVVVDMDHDDSTTLLERLGASGRLRGHATPLLGLTRRGDLRTKLRAFDLGVDDILTVPFSPEELLARSIVITRRATGVDLPIVPTIHIADIEVDVLNREVRIGGSVFHLSSLEQSLLYLLASRGGKVVTREEILDSIWGTDYVAESNIVDRHIRSLRVKLQDDFRHPKFIATEPGLGYRFIPTFANRGWNGAPDRSIDAPGLAATTRDRPGAGRLH